GQRVGSSQRNDEPLRGQASSDSGTSGPCVRRETLLRMCELKGDGATANSHAVGGVWRAEEAEDHHIRQFSDERDAGFPAGPAEYVSRLRLRAGVARRGNRRGYHVFKRGI